MDWTNDESNLYLDDLLQLTRHVSDIAGELFSAVGLIETMQAVLISSRETIEGCDHAGLFLTVDGVVAPIETDDPVVSEMDALQNASGEGPCLDAVTHPFAFYANDLYDDLRWPHFAPQAASTGIRSVLALPLGEGERRGALNLYSRFPDAFGVFDRAKAAILASLAGQALSVAEYYEETEYDSRTHVDLHEALTRRNIIGQAQGILMEREHITSDAAFDLLRQASKQLNMKLSEVAQSLSDTGKWPALPPDRLP